MNNNRIKLPTTILSRTRAEQILGEIAALKIDQRTKQNAMDAELTRVRETYEGDIGKFGKEIENRTVLLESWASANPAEFPVGRKSIEFTHGVLGYRTGMPKLKTLAKWTWEKVLSAIDGQGWSDLVRVKREVNKEAVIGQANVGQMDGAALRSIGVTVAQDETFFVEVKLEEQPMREEVAA